jgi:hypothetical protein
MSSDVESGATAIAFDGIDMSEIDSFEIDVIETSQHPALREAAASCRNFVQLQLQRCVRSRLDTAARRPLRRNGLLRWQTH